MSLKDLFRTKRDRDDFYEHYDEDASFKMPIEDIFEDIKNGKIKSLSSKDYLQVDDFFETDENGKTLLEIVYEYKVNIASSLGMRLFNDERIIEKCIKNKKLIYLIVKQFNNTYTLNEDVSNETLFKQLSVGISLIEFLIKNNLISVFIINKIDDIRVYELLIKYGRFDALAFLNENLLFRPYKEYSSLFEYLIAHNRVTVQMISNFIVHKEACEICRNYNKIYLLKHAKSSFLLHEYKDGTKVIDCLIRGNNADGETFYRLGSTAEKEVIRYIIKYNAYRYLVFYPNMLFEKVYYDPNKIYLDLLLENYNKSIDNYLADIDIKNITLENRAKLYIKCSDYNVNMFLPRITVDLLLQRVKGSSFVEALLNESKEKTLTKILTPTLCKNVDIASALKMYGVDIKDANVPTDKIDEHKAKKYKILDKKIQDKVERKLYELKSLFMNDGISSEEDVNTLVASYKSLASRNYRYLDRELDLLIEYKKQHNGFVILRTYSTPNFSGMGQSVSLNNSSLAEFNHEIGHALHYIGDMSRTPQELDKVLTMIRSDESILYRINAFSTKLDKIRKEQIIEAEKIYKQKYGNYFDKNRKEKIASLIRMKSDELIKRFEEIGYDPKEIKKAVNELYDVDEEEYIKRFEYVKTREIAKKLLTEKYDAYTSISDMLDAIYLGRLQDGMCFNEKGQPVKVYFGHGINYYNRPDVLFQELVANYSEIIKSENAEEALIYLKSLVGEEFVNLLSNYYEENILHINEPTKEMISHGR